MKIGFTSTDAMPTYRYKGSNSLHVTESMDAFRRDLLCHGQVVKMDDDEAMRLIESFPENFRKEKDHKAFMTGMADKAKSDADSVASAGPAGDPGSAGDTTGVDLDELSEADQQKYTDIVAKVDAGDDLTDQEQAFLESVEAAEGGTGDATEHSD